MTNTFKLLYSFLKITTNHSKLNFVIICGLIILTFLFETLSIFSVAPILSSIGGDQFQFDMKILESIFSFFFEKITLINTLIFLGTCVLIKSIFLILSIYIQSKISLNSLKKIQHELFKGIILTKYEKLIEGKTSHIGNYLFPELERLRRGANTANSILLNFFGITVLFTGSLFINYKISIFFLTVGILLSLTIFILNKYFETQGRLQTENRNLILENIQLLLHNIKNFKIINKNYIFKQRIFSSISKIINSELLIVLYKSITTLYEPIIIFIIIFLVFSFNVEVNKDYLTDIVVVIVLYNRIFGKLSIVTSNLAGLNLFRTPLEKINHLINKFNNNKEDFKGLKTFTLNSNITIKDLSFKYGETKVFDNLNIILEAKKIISIYGKSGKGKTTLADMFIKLYDTKNIKGQIYLDKTNLMDLNPIYLRRHIGYVTQDTYLFNTSIRFNLTMSQDNNLDKKIIELIKRFNLEEIFEKGNINLNKEIIDGGANISGGQKQRLLIIRELLKNPKLIIFDEGLGSLENKNKIEILKNIKELYPDLTILNFTHDSFFKEISDVVIEL